jgi:hypothetical protein
MQSDTDNDFVLRFSGNIRYDTIGNLIHELKEKIFIMGLKTTLYKKILLVMIESLENMMKYTAHFSGSDNQKKLHHPSFSIQKINGKYLINCSNLIENKDIQPLENKLNFLNSLDNYGLKELYKSTITNGQFSHKGGAGLGLIEIAKVSSEKLQYVFEPINDHYSVFRFIIIIE